MIFWICPLAISKSGSKVGFLHMHGLHQRNLRDGFLQLHPTQMCVSMKASQVVPQIFGSQKSIIAGKGG